MIEEVVIEEVQENDWGDIRWLYFNGFSTIFGDKTVQNYNHSRRQNHLVARIGQCLVGFGSYCSGSDDLDLSMRSFSELKAVHDCDKDRINKFLQGYVEMIRYGGEVSVELYDNEVTQSLSNRDLAEIIIRGQDFYLTNLVVSPRFQRRGIGKKLAEERIKIAKKSGSKIAYVSCIEGRHSLSIYQRLGFSPVIRLKPGYPDGSAAVRLLKIL
ncbi:MAG: N-acetyltransferase [archaeon]|nr:N-acetyltransferase [archaeon]